jgi:hypothetical protein
MPMNTTRRAWDAAAAFVVFAVALAHVFFLMADLRVPRDLGQYYQSLPILFQSLERPSPSILGLVFERGGWYNALLAVWMRLFGRTGDTFQSMDVIGVAAICALAGLVARSAAPSERSRAAFVATALTAAAPIVAIQGRQSWIHIPETALVLGALLAHVRDPRLERVSTIVISGICGALAVWLRPSGLVWMASLAPLLLAVPEAQRRRAAYTAGAWLLGVLPLLSDMRLYLDAKMEARGRYFEQVPELLIQVQSGIGLPVLVVTLIGMGLALVRRRGPLEAVLGGWLVLPFVLWSVFGAGIDNFTPVAPALALFAAFGYAERPIVAALTGVLWFGYYLPQYLWPGDDGPTVRISNFLGVPATPNRGSFYRPFGDPAYEVVPALIDATCPAPEICVVAVDQGLFEPYAEDPGFLRLFLTGRDHVRLSPIAMAGGGDRVVQALVRYECGEENDRRWRERFPDSLTRIEALISSSNLEEAWKGEAYPGCMVLWLTPGGEMAIPERAPGEIPSSGASFRGIGTPMRPDAPPPIDGLPPAHGPGSKPPGQGGPPPPGTPGL